jgi:hypothetical protein
LSRVRREVEEDRRQREREKVAIMKVVTARDLSIT